MRLRRSLSALVAALVMGIAAPAALAASDFRSSFEAGDPQPAWTNTVESGPDGAPKTSGVRNPKPTGIPGNISDRVVEVRASGEFAAAGEVKENLVDGSPFTKWLVFARTAWIEFEFAEPVTIQRYALTSANDAEGRDPQDWALQGWDGSRWVDVDTQAGQTFGERHQRKIYDVTTPAA